MDTLTQEQIAQLRALLDLAGASVAKPAKAKGKPRKASASGSRFSQLAGGTPVRKGKGSKFTITLGDLTFACEDRGNNKIVAHTTNGTGDERWIVFRPSTPDALASGQYLAVVARRYGLVK